MNPDTEELEYTTQDHLDEDRGRNIWNIATISGIIIVFLTFAYLVQAMAGGMGGPNFSGMIQILPIVAGIVVIIVGYGYLKGEKQKKDQTMLKNDIEIGSKAPNERGKRSFRSARSKRRRRRQGAHEKKRHEENKRERGSNSPYIDDYGMQVNKKLFKSRTDKKVFGVCGGLAAYFDMDSTVMRLIFVAATLIGWGSVAILYIVLAIVLKKEPIEWMEDFDEAN